MKNLIKLFFATLFLAGFLSSCEKDENKIYLESGTPPVLTASVTNTIPLSFLTKDNEAIKLFWTNPDYRFTTGISSQDVFYVIEVDTSGANFTNPNKLSVSVSQELSRSFTQNDFNDFLLNTMLLTPGQPHNLQIRVNSTLVNNSAVLHSNVLNFVVTPYAIPPKVTPPASGKLFITGGATPGSWMGGGDPELPSQKFNQISPTLYELPSIALSGGGSYLFVPVYGDWSNKYGAIGANNTNNVNGDDFKANGGDLLAPAIGGNFKIVVDFQRGKFTVTRL